MTSTTIPTLKKISQQYFDSIVNENLNDFGMEQQEAIDDAINQLNSQGCDLSMICKFGSAEQNELFTALKKLDELVRALNGKKMDLTSGEEHDEFKDINESACRELNVIKSKFVKDLSFRVVATRIQPPDNSAYKIFMSYFEYLNAPKSTPNLKKNQEDLLIESFLSAFQAYLYQQSDILDTSGLKMLIRLTNSEELDTSGVSGFGSHTNILQCLLKCINTSCHMSESNRQFFVENGLCENLMLIFKQHKTNNAILCEACQLIRSLLLDDDVRVEFGKSHEHAKFIASQLNGLDVLLHIGLSNEETLNEETLGNLMLTLSKLAVRNEYCQEICDKGGLKFVLKCIEEKHLRNQVLLKSALSLLKSICNNDQVKYEATKSNAIDLIKGVVQKYNNNSQICELSCAALSTILLRNVEASEQLFSLHVHTLLVQLLNVHMSKSPKMTKVCCLALRNSVSRCRHHKEKLLELKIEDTLNSILKENNQICTEECRALLRDLDCQLELKELWTGSGVQMKHDI
jgi:hypothetical protein